MAEDRNADRLADDSAPDGGIPVDLTERPDDFLVGAELPGYRKQNIDVSVAENSVTIEAGRGADAVDATVSLPEPVVTTHVDARYDDDILWVTLKKR